MARRGIDPTGRRAALALGAARAGLGVGALFATRPALKALGFAEVDAAGLALGRLAGGRDIALGLLALAARDDRRALRIAVLAGVAVDASDAVTFGVAVKDPVARRAGIGGVLSGGAAAIAGAWAWRRLGAQALSLR